MSVGSDLQKLKRLDALLVAGVLLGGAAHAWAAAASQSMNPDGISYLDMGSAAFDGQWGALINAAWSPLYAFVLGLATYLVRPTISTEFPLVHVVNFLIYGAALFAFRAFWIRVMRTVESADAAVQTGNEGAGRSNMPAPVPKWLQLLVGYLLFSYVSLALINVWAVTPDMLMSAFVYLAAALILEIRLHGPDRWRFPMLGGLLGLGYLTKTVMLPLAPWFMLSGYLVSRRTGGARGAVVSAFLVFLMFVAPYIVGLSLSVGHFEYGSSGKLTYLRYVNHIPYPHWTGEPEGFGEPDHPLTELHNDPTVFGFAHGEVGTYPLSFDPAYWYEGAEVHVSVENQIARLRQNLAAYLRLLLKTGFVWFGLFGLFLFRRGAETSTADVSRRFGAERWVLSMVGLAALALYAVVLVEGRYVGAFVALIAADLFKNGLMRLDRRRNAMATAMIAVTAVALAGSLAVFNLQGAFKLSGDPNAEPGPAITVRPGGSVETANVLEELSIGPGDQIGVIGYAFNAFWARLARVRIVAQLPEEAGDLFWDLDSGERMSILRAFSSAGAAAVVAEAVPANADTRGWHRVGRSATFVRMLGEYDD